MYKSLIDTCNNEKFRLIVENSVSLNEVARKLGFKYAPGKNSKIKIKNRIAILNLSLKIKEKTYKQRITKPRHRVVQVKSRCIYCNKEYIARSYASHKFCSLDCQNNYNYYHFIQEWKSGINDGSKGYGVNISISNYLRRYIFEKYNFSCAKCGFNKLHPIDNKPILEIHHIDGNCKNNKEENLILLCPNCHALTDTYRCRNKNSTRIRRK